MASTVVGASAVIIGSGIIIERPFVAVAGCKGLNTGAAGVIGLIECC